MNTMTALAKNTKYGRSFLMDEVAAATLSDGTRGSVALELLDEASRQEITNFEWLHSRLFASLGVADHAVEGRQLHTVEAVVRRPVFPHTHSQRANWEW